MSSVVLSHPAVAIAIGLAAGVACLAASRLSVGVMRPGHLVTGVALTAVLLFGRFAFSVAAMGVYHMVAPQGFVPFACAYVGGFIVAYNFELLQFSGLLHRGQWQKGR